LFTFVGASRGHLCDIAAVLFSINDTKQKHSYYQFVFVCVFANSIMQKVVSEFIHEIWRKSRLWTGENLIRLWKVKVKFLSHGIWCVTLRCVAVLGGAARHRDAAR